MPPRRAKDPKAKDALKKKTKDKKKAKTVK